MITAQTILKGTKKKPPRAIICTLNCFRAWLRRTLDRRGTAESRTQAGLLFSVSFVGWKIDFKEQEKVVSAGTVNARVSACLREPGGPTVVWTRCECLWVCLQGVFQYSSFTHLLSNWPPEACWAGREADQLIVSLTPHCPHLNHSGGYPIQPLPPKYKSCLCHHCVCHMLRSNMATSTSPTVPPSAFVCSFICLLANQSWVRSLSSLNKHIPLSSSTRLIVLWNV